MSTTEKGPRTAAAEPVALPDPANLAFVEGLYLDFLADPAAVPEPWRAYFERVRREDAAAGRLRPGPAFRPPGLFAGADGAAAPAAAVDAAKVEQDRVDRLIRTYLVRGHLAAAIDPLGRPRPPVPELEPSFWGFTEADRGRRFSTHGLAPTGELLPLGEIVARLRATYCGSIGAHFMHIHDRARRLWLRRRMESTANRVHLSRDEQLRILRRLSAAVVLEEFIQQKYPGAKSFSLEGAESLIPLLDLAIQAAAGHGVRDIVLAMAHRGRLNVLVNIMGKRPRDVFREFEDRDDPLREGRGDVKYHLGHSTDWEVGGHRVHLSLCFNPSHLEFVNPVALGRTRAKQDRMGDRERTRALAVLIHGDAAFAGEGIVQETLNLSRLEGYRTGGTLHVIVNNQIGFTTTPEEYRSFPYAADVAKMLQVPVFQVNGEDPEAVAHVVRLAMDFRREFQSDVVIDMYCFRRRGHNEGDEPSFSQPLMYQLIERRATLAERYLEHLLALGQVTREEAEAIVAERRAELDAELAEARSPRYVPVRERPAGVWTGYHGAPGGDAEEVDTSVDEARLTSLLEALARVPEGFSLHPTLARGLARRREMAAGKRPLDWAAGEALAFATLAVEGHRVRLSGQDTVRGTFSHRHAALHDTRTGEVYMPLAHLAPDQAPVEIYNSPLSEAGVLGFEYGYSLDWPEGLVAWEAQFGDFVNAAQVIVDQFIVSAEEKWRRLSGLVLLLPHGFEGAGPEHSSARLERFLELAVNDNIQVVNPTTPAQLFHVLRRQVLRRWRKPLVVMTPKSLLRHPRVVSPLSALAEGRFEPILPDAEADPARVRRVLLCSGKVYYDLVALREELGRDDVAIARLEQLYPLREQQLAGALACYAPGTPVVWVQEEPANMGAWRYLLARFGDTAPGGYPFTGVCRPPAASPATGWSGRHKAEQARLLKVAIDGR